MGRESSDSYATKVGPPPGWAAVARLAARQHGTVAARQLLRLGVSKRTIAAWAAAGLLHRVHRGVYAVGHAALSREGVWMAAVLAGGPGAVLSHRSAAALWGIRDRWWPRVDVMVPRSGRAKPEGIEIHRPRRLEPEDVTTHRGIPTTTPARTIVDLADVTSTDEIRRALHQAEVLSLADAVSVQATAERTPGRRGSGRLKQALRQGPDRTRSQLERQMKALCRKHRIEAPEVNERVEGLEVDFLWRKQRLVAETDGWRFHRTREAFERDRERDQRLTRAGYRVVRFTHHQLQSDPAGVATTLRAALA